ncbi:MAG: LysR family transcriptional regulator [Verrucomicrobia bacterium]|nr:LysR family transcriptional regulator [Verrucomicrobiota bacterium]
MDLNRVHPILLQTFLEVAEAGQISEAARRLHLSQPAVTGQIRRLESNLERALFIRTPRGVSLTPEGTLLRDRLQGVFAALEEIVLELDQTRDVTGIVTIGASTTVARYFVPRIFVRFHHYHPTTALKLVVGNTDTVLDHLREHRLGLGLVEGLTRSPGLRLEPFIRDEIIPVCAARIPDMKLRRAIEAVKAPGDLQGLPLIWREPGAGTRAVVERHLEGNGVDLRKLDYRFELGSSEAIKTLVIAGLGIAFLSSWEIQQEISLGFVRHLLIPSLHIDRAYSWAVSSGDLGGLAGEFYHFANSIRDELIPAAAVRAGIPRT